MLYLFFVIFLGYFTWRLYIQYKLLDRDEPVSKNIINEYRDI